MTKIFSVITCLVLLLVSCSKEPKNSIIYSIEPIPLEDRTNFKIDVEFELSQKDSIIVSLPTDNYGTPDIHQYIEPLQPKNGTSILKTKNEQSFLVKPNSSGKADLTYVISYDPSRLEGSAFAPVINEDYFSMAGCQWMLHIGDDEAIRNFQINIKNPPVDWKLHSSIGQNPSQLRINGTYNELISSRIGGGGSFESFLVKGKPVNILIKGDFQIPLTDMFSSVKQIVELLREWFNDYEQPFYQVVINERNHIVAGTAFNNQFVCFVSPNVTIKELNVILAHEMFHNWLPSKIDIKPKKDNDYRYRHDWFTEGFTTYFAGKLLSDSKLLSKDDFVELINDDIKKIADSPIRNISISELSEAAKNNRATSEHKNLAYWRGHILALKWDAQLQNLDTKSSLSQFIRHLYKYASKSNGELTEDDFFEFCKQYGIDAQGDFDKYIVRGETIKLDEILPIDLENEFEVQNVQFHNFSPGFDLLETRRTKLIKGLKENHNAYKAGLRNGMEFVKARNARRNGEWSLKRPYKVTVLIDSKEKEFEYIPYEETIMLNFIQKIGALNYPQ